MGQKLYKLKYTREDIAKVERYIKSHASGLLVEVWQNGSEDGDVIEISANSLEQAITLTNKYYDSTDATRKVAELIMRERNGEYTAIYHTEKNRSGLTMEVLNYAR